MADYIDRQAAIAALMKFAEKCKGSDEAATAAAMAISVISRLPVPWRNAKTNFPPEGKDILIAASDLTVWQGRYQDGKYFEYILKEEMYNPPCWMPMPDEPAMRKAEKNIREALK